MKLSQLFESENKLDKYTLSLINAINNGFKNNFKILIQGDMPLYRGVDIREIGKNKKVVIDGETYYSAFNVLQSTQRNSLTSSNILNNFQAKSDLWKDFPKRNFATMTTNNMDNADSFGDLCYVIPADNVTTFAAIRDDWNYATLKNSKLDTDTLKSSMGHLVNAIRVIDEYVDDLDDCDEDDEDCYMGKRANSGADKSVIYCGDIIRDFNEHTGSNWGRETTFGEIDEVEELSSLFDLCRRLFPYMKRLDKHPHWRIRIMYEDFKEAFSMLKLSKLNSAQEVFNTFFSPEKMRVLKFNSLSTLKKYKNVSLEVWFTGEYLLISADEEYLQIISSYIK